MRKFGQKIHRVNAEVVGLDVHKHSIVFSRVNRRGEEIACGRFDADTKALRAFQAEHIGRRLTHLALEASGCSLWVHDLLVEAYGEERVHVAHAKKVRLIANSTEKNDANDAFWLAYLTQESRLPEVWLPRGIHRELRQATRQRASLVQDRTRVLTRMHSHLAQMGEKVKGLRSKKGSEALDEIESRIEGIALAVVQHLRRHLAWIQEQIESWEARLEALVEKVPEVGTLRREIPGVGPILSATIIAEVGCIRRFRSAGALAKYAGLTPTDRSSGGTLIHGAITKEGSSQLRWALVQAAVGCLRARQGPARTVGDWIRRKQERLGAKKKGHVAGARKLAEATWRLFELGECFDAARPFSYGR
jgi:transposase